MTEPARMRPKLDEYNRPYWTAGAEGALKLQQCNSCSSFNHPALPVCRKCQSEDLGYSALPGTGAIDTFTINHQSWYPGLDPPYVVAIVELPEQPGLRLTTNLVGCAPEEAVIGMALHVTFEQYEDVWLPFFAPAAQPGGGS